MLIINKIIAQNVMADYNTFSFNVLSMCVFSLSYSHSYK